MKVDGYMNKIKVFIMLMLVLSFAVFMNGCGNDSGQSGDNSSSANSVHAEHKFSSEYSFDSNRHFRVCQCGAIADSDAHVDNENNPGTCRECGYVIYELCTVMVITDATGKIYVENTTIKSKRGDDVTIIVRLSENYRLLFDGKIISSSEKIEQDLVYYIELMGVSADLQITLSCELVECEHNWLDSDCTNPIRCDKCGLEVRDPLGHNMQPATCESPSHCSRCGYTEGAVLPHDMKPATCESPSHCSRCGYTEGAVLPHDMKPATCESPSHCSRCDYTEGTAAAHQWSEATCISVSSCGLCGATQGGLAGHNYVPNVVKPTCTITGYTLYVCSVCSHDYISDYTDATGHSGGESNLGICNICGEKYMNILTYCTYGGAVGDGVTDDFYAIKRTHERANATGATVVADPGKTFNLGQHADTITIMTDTVWTGATFIIDDSSIAPTDPERTIQIFSIAPSVSPRTITGISSLKAGQTNLGGSFGFAYLLKITNDNVKQYIRYGANADTGASQQEIILVDANGNVDPSTPIMWNYDTVTSVIAYYADDTPITITGGHFITIANSAPRRYTYYNRGISITRSNVTVRGLTHTIQGEGDSGAPYNGFINITNCTNILLDSIVLTGHKVYKLETDVNNSMGTYDMSFASANNITCLNCSQTNSITDTAYWGIMGSNYCKNLTYDGCVFSRFDAHKGTYNATIINSEIGHQKVSIIGSGLMIIENTIIHGNSIVALRGDYGSTWQGEIIIRNVTLNNTSTPTLVSGSWNNHYFGYTCYLPENVTIEGIKIAKGTYFYILPNLPTGVDQPTISSDVNKNPYVLTKSITVSGLPAGNTCYVSINMTLFASVKLTMK